MTVKVETVPSGLHQMHCEPRDNCGSVVVPSTQIWSNQ